MKIVIEHGSIKREIDGNFNVCGSKDDLLRFAYKVQEVCNSEDFTYGWISISDKKKEYLINQSVKKWDDK